MSEYILNAKNDKRLIYCRYGDKYVSEIEKRKNSIIKQDQQA